MNNAILAVTSLTAAANAGAAFADFTKAGFVLKTSSEVGVPLSWFPLLAWLKAAGAAGLIVGLFVVPIIGIAAAAGLVVYFTGALIAHIRAGVFYNIAFPGLYLALAVATLALSAH